MKILLYNWAQFDDPRGMGGGVTVYLRNLIEEFSKRDGFELYFLSGGLEYDALRAKPYIVETTSKSKTRCRCFKMVNSPIPAPMSAISSHPSLYTNDEVSIELFELFLRHNGPFDVIHIHDFEGVSVNVLRLKSRYPKTKFIFSVHNYATICPIAQNFQSDTKKSCSDFCAGRHCLKCCTGWTGSTLRAMSRARLYQRFPLATKLPYKILAHLISFGCIAQKLYWQLEQKPSRNAGDYVRFREHNIAMLNKYCDLMLAVSERTRQIMVQHGVLPEKIKVSYIGTRVADSQLGHSAAECQGGLFKIAFLGYAREDKGFPFLIRALSHLPNEVRSKISVVLAAREMDQNVTSEYLKGFGRVEFYNGYTHANFDEIFSGVHLGIVPVVWEDNLPQVAIELVANGIPILCSDMGGASELCSDKRFIFKGDDEQSFMEHLTQFVENRNLVVEYWQCSRKLVTMSEHINELVNIYGSI